VQPVNASVIALDWGTVPDGVAALGTVAAFAGLFLVLRQQGRDAQRDREARARLEEQAWRERERDREERVRLEEQTQRERDRDREDRARYEEQRALEVHRQERAQAMQVSWWIDRVEWWDPTKDDTNESVRPFVDAGPDFSAGGFHPDMYIPVPLVILNSSGDCLYHVEVKLPDYYCPEAPRRQAGVLPPGRSRFMVLGDIGYLYASPTQGTRRQGDAAWNRMVEYVEFRDRDDVIWRRDRNGGLQKQEWRPPEPGPLYAM
jgi:hypothetical protein